MPYKTLETRILSLRLPFPAQRLALARGLQRAATRVGHHHFAALTEVACGRIEAEMVPRDERGERRKKVKKKKKKRKGKEWGGKKEEVVEREGRDGDGQDGEWEEEEDEGVVSGQGEDFVRHAQKAKERDDDEESQIKESQSGRREHHSRSCQFDRAGVNREDHKRNQNQERSQRFEGSGDTDRSEHCKHRKRKHKHKHKQGKKKSHSDASAVNTKPKLNWKILLRGFIKGVVAYEMQKKLAAKDGAAKAPSQRQPRSSGQRRKRMVDRPLSISHSPGPSRRRPSARPLSPGSLSPNPSSRPPSAGSLSPPPSPNPPSPSPTRGRPRLRRPETDDLPPLTPGQVHWREVRAREQGQEDMVDVDGAQHPEESGIPSSGSPSPLPTRGRPGLRSQESDDLPPLTPGQVHWREVRAREQGQEDMINADGAQHAEELAMPTQSRAGTPSTIRSVQTQDELFGGGWSFPANLAAAATRSSIV